jgi:hypothetical protein
MPALCGNGKQRDPTIRPCKRYGNWLQCNAKNQGPKAVAGHYPAAIKLRSQAPRLVRTDYLFIRTDYFGPMTRVGYFPHRIKSKG